MLTVSVANEITDLGAFALSWPGLAEARFAVGFIVMGAGRGIGLAVANAFINESAEVGDFFAESIF